MGGCVYNKPNEKEGKADRSEPTNYGSMKLRRAKEPADSYITSGKQNYTNSSVFSKKRRPNMPIADLDSLSIEEFGANLSMMYMTEQESIENIEDKNK
jgi:hypothetical protein